MLTGPGGVDPGDFIRSGGTLRPRQTAAATVGTTTVAAAVAAYRINLAPSSRGTVGVHLNNLLRAVPPAARGPLDRLSPRHLDEFVQRRLRERSPDTVTKERATLAAFLAWSARQGFTAADLVAGLTRVKAGGEPPRFLTVAEVDGMIARGGLTAAEERALWDRLYLCPAEIAGLLSRVRARGRRPVSHIAHAVPAYTGMRRGEVLRLRWDDVVFDQDVVVARRRKQSRQRAGTARRIDLHPELRAILRDWKRRRPAGQFVLSDDGSLAPLARHQAEERFWQPLRGTGWVLADGTRRPKVGFHTYRHSFASNLAAAGVDQRVIDEFMGHTTEAMRRRYRHLFPRDRRSAIESFSLAVPPVGGADPLQPSDVARRRSAGMCPRSGTTA